MQTTYCDRCGKEFDDEFHNNEIKLRDEIKKGENTIKFTIRYYTTQQIITPKGAENADADICPNCCAALLIKDVSRNLDYNN